MNLHLFSSSFYDFYFSNYYFAYKYILFNYYIKYLLFGLKIFIKQILKKTKFIYCLVSLCAFNIKI
jgi:hypothetical protein